MHRVAEARLPTEHGDVAHRRLQERRRRRTSTSRSCTATSRDGENVLVRMHSKCLTGDVFHSLRCDCGWQLDTAMEMIAAEGRGVDRLPRSGRAGHRAAQQAQGVRAPGPRRRHRRGERAARLQARSAQLRHRRADPARSRVSSRSARSRTTRARWSASRATGFASASACRSSSRRTTRTPSYLRTKRDKLGHLLARS